MKINIRKKIVKPLVIVIIIGFAVFILIDSIIMPSYVQKGKTTKVPDVIGLSLEEAKKKLREAGLEPKEAEYKTDKRYEIGIVTLQNPLAESEVKYGRGVYLTISGGEELVDVPNLKGISIREATFNLERNGLKLGMISYETSEEMFANTIIRQGIPPNTKVKSGNHIEVTVSQGRATDMHPVPDVTLKTLAEVEKLLMDGGFQVGKITYQTNLDLLPNTILEQYPHSGELVRLGRPIDLIITQKVDNNIKVEN
jgi:serine/threonine-protein kinase